VALAIPDMWQDLNLNIVAPKTILDQQVEYLQSKGKGVLGAEVTTVTGTEDFVIYRLDLIAIQLGGQRYRILVATHRTEYYPVQIEADCFRPKTKSSAVKNLVSGFMDREYTESLTWPPENDWRVIARSQDDFMDKLKTILRSAEVRSVIDSVIARTNELQLTSNGKTNTEHTSNGS